MTLYYIRGSINKINLVKDYDKTKAKFIKTIDKYIVLIFLIYIIISYIIKYLLIKTELGLYME